MDLGLAKGSPVRALQGGTVIQSLSDPTGGEMIAVRTPSGEVIRYLHMDTGSRQYKSGDNISSGDMLGRVGSTGQSTGAHLHVDVKDSKGNYIDPKRYFG